MVFEQMSLFEDDIAKKPKKAKRDWDGNNSATWKIIGASNHSDKEREPNDYYATDPIAVDKLVEVEQLPKNIWECACGGGHLVRRLRELGHNVIATDIIQRGGGRFYSRFS